MARAESGALGPSRAVRDANSARTGSPWWLDLCVPASLLLAIALACFLWPALYPHPSPIGGNVLDANLPPLSAGHLLGTDPNGNDVLARLLHGGRTSLTIAVGVNALGLLTGGVLGGLAGYYRNAIDSIVMRTMDVLIAFPSLVAVLVAAHVLGSGPLTTVLALALFSLPAYARIARASTLRLREQPFILAGQLSGTRTWRMLTGHILPNILPQLAVFALLGMGVVVTIEGALSFLGLGVPAPAPSWGGMIAQGQEVLFTTPSVVLAPSILLFITVLAFNVLGERLRARWSTS